MSKKYSTSLNRTRSLAVFATFLAFTTLSVTQAANITMTGNNAASTSSFNAGTNWPGAAAPTAGNNYFTAGFQMRTPTTGASLTFAGDALTVGNGATTGTGAGFIQGKGPASQTLTITNFTLNGGMIYMAGANTDTNTLIIASPMAVTASTFNSLGALGAAANGSANFETLEFTGSITGGSGATVTIGGAQNAGANTGVVKFSAANTYSGTITVATPTAGSGFVASTTNRLLQLNHVNAVQNATLNLTSVANGVSFASAANTAAFNVGALSGNSNQALTDTASAAVALNAGGNGATTTYSGILSGSGSLTKSGAGTMTLSGASTYTGGTTVSAGTLTLASTGSFANSASVSLAAGAILDTTAQTTFAMLGAQPFHFTINAAGAGSAGVLAASGLDLSNGFVDFTAVGALDDPAYTIATYTSLTGMSFNSVTSLPSGYALNYNYLGGNVIALVAVPEPREVGVAFALSLLGIVFVRRQRRLACARQSNHLP